MSTVNSGLAGSPASGVGEKQWLSTWLAVRRTVLLTTAGKGSNWADAVARLAVYKELMALGAWQLDGSMQLSGADTPPPPGVKGWVKSGGYFCDSCYIP